MGTPVYGEDSKDIYSKIKLLGDTIELQRSDFKDRVAEIKKNCDAMEAEHIELLKQLHILSTEFKVEISKIVVKLSIFTFGIVTILTILGELFLGSLSIFK